MSILLSVDLASGQDRFPWESTGVHVPLYFSKVEPQYSRPCLHASEKDRAPGSKLAQERRATDSFMVRGVRQ